ncbi:hypothetical protein [Pseudomonas aeruginosa]|uniref:hypothetical protein n=1 Tax=Pseudomonas aeruginosa TaxID=287 RepID=UPI000E678C4F|nr:hypothetical protein [Pseudomonas aeruginosa]RIY89767.1 hypothetical protein AXW94_30300 [Pseudomonas aeruginosa]
MIRPIWLIAPAMTAAAAVLGAYHASQEVEPSTYIALTEAWPRLSEYVRSELRDAMVDGHLSSWEFAGLNRKVMDSAGYMTWTIGGKTPAEKDARAKFAELLQQ